jgi:hypothetical protein
VLGKSFKHQGNIMADWYYAPGGQQLGPVPFTDLQALAARGQLAFNDLVWTEGMPQWQPAAQVAGLMPVGPTQPPMPGASYAPPYATPVAYQTPYIAPSPHANLALTGMILTLVSLLIGGPFLAIPGAVCGWIALKGMKRTNNFQNRGFALTALWIGIAELALVCLGIAIFVLFAYRR